MRKDRIGKRRIVPLLSLLSQTLTPSYGIGTRTGEHNGSGGDYLIFFYFFFAGFKNHTKVSPPTARAARLARPFVLTLQDARA